MIALRDFLTRMQSQDTGCEAVLRIDLRDGTVIECCGDATTTAAVALGRVICDLAAPWQAMLPGTGMPQEVILLADDCAYVCGRLADSPHQAVAAFCRGTTNLGLIISMFHDSLRDSEVEAGV